MLDELRSAALAEASRLKLLELMRSLSAWPIAQFVRQYGALRATETMTIDSKHLLSPPTGADVGAAGMGLEMKAGGGGTAHGVVVDASGAVPAAGAAAASATTVVSTGWTRSPIAELPISMLHGQSPPEVSCLRALCSLVRCLSPVLPCFACLQAHLCCADVLVTVSHPSDLQWMVGYFWCYVSPAVLAKLDAKKYAGAGEAKASPVSCCLRPHFIQPLPCHAVQIKKVQGLHRIRHARKIFRERKRLILALQAALETVGVLGAQLISL